MSILSKHEAEYIRKRKWYDKVELFICPSEFYRKKLEEGKFTGSPIVTMRNPLPLDTEFDCSTENEGYVLYFGRLSHEKGVKTLIEAAKLCSCHLVILGTGPEEEALKALAEDCSNIEFKGFQTGEALQNYVKNSKCVVLPSEWYENGPYSAMEAMVLGKPLIVSNMGGLPELVEDGVNGYIYEKTAEALAESIRKLQDLPEEAYEKMAQCSLEKAKVMFCAETYVETIEAHYKNVRG